MKKFLERVFVLGFVLIIGIPSTSLRVYAEWAAPTKLPPGGQPARPVDTSGGEQAKEGKLKIENTFTASQNATVSGVLTVGNRIYFGGIGKGAFLFDADDRKLKFTHELKTGSGTDWQVLGTGGGGGGGDSFWKASGKNIINTNEGSVGVFGGKLILGGESLPYAFLENSDGKVKVPGLMAGEICLGTVCKKSWDGTSTVSPAETGWIFDEDVKLIRTDNSVIVNGADGLKAKKFCFTGAPGEEEKCLGGTTGSGTEGGVWEVSADGAIRLVDEHRGKQVAIGMSVVPTGFQTAVRGPVYVANGENRLEFLGGDFLNFVRSTSGLSVNFGYNDDVGFQVGVDGGPGIVVGRGGSLLTNRIAVSGESLLRGGAIVNKLKVDDSLVVNGNVGISGEYVLLGAENLALYGKAVSMSGDRFSVNSSVAEFSGGEVRVQNGANLVIAPRFTTTAGDGAAKLVRGGSDSYLRRRFEIILPAELTADGIKRLIKDSGYSDTRYLSWWPAIADSRGVVRSWDEARIRSEYVGGLCGDTDFFNQECSRDNYVAAASSIPAAYSTFFDYYTVQRIVRSAEEVSYKDWYDMIQLNTETSLTGGSLTRTTIGDVYKPFEARGDYFIKGAFSSDHVEPLLSMVDGEKPPCDTFSDVRGRGRSCSKYKTAFYWYTVDVQPRLTTFTLKVEPASGSTVSPASLVGGNITLAGGQILYSTPGGSGGATQGSIYYDEMTRSLRMGAGMKNVSVDSVEGGLKMDGLRTFAVLGGGLETGPTGGLSCSGPWGEMVEPDDLGTRKREGCACPSGSGEKAISLSSGASGTYKLCFYPAPR